MLEPLQFTLWAIAAWLPCALINQEPNIALTATAGVVFLGAGAIGYFLIGAKLHERALFSSGALLLIIPGWVTDAIGMSLGMLGVASQLLRRSGAAVAQGTTP